MTPTSFRLKAPARLDQVRLMVLAARAVCQECLGTVPVLDDIELVLAELLNNAVEHGVPAAPGAVELEVGLMVSPQAVDIEVLDGFAPFQAPTAEPALPDDELATGGFGLFLIHELMDTVEFVREGDHNVVRCHKRLDVTG